jgi:hypothetical protein
MKKLWKKIVSFFRDLASGSKKLVYVVWTSAKKEICDILNDKELQALALEAIRTAAKNKLKGEEAWNFAYAKFKEACVAKGINFGTAVLETVLQNVYLVFKFTEGDSAESVPQTKESVSIERDSCAELPCFP